MKEAFEKIKERLEEETYDMEICEEQFDANSPYFIDVPYKMVKLEDALSIVSEVEAEYGNGWIPCSERLPSEEETKDCASFIVTKKVRDKFSIIDFCLFGTEGEWLVRESEEVIAWMPLPSPFKPTTD